VRIVIAEDQVLLRDGLVRLLEGAGHAVVGQAGDARTLIEQVNATRPDLVIADIRMPPDHADDGARAVVHLRERMPTLAVLMLTQVLEPTAVARLIVAASPAFGYLLKDRVLDTESFLERVEAVAEGGTAIDPVILERHARRIGGPDSLTSREVEVLKLVASGRSNAGVAAELQVSRRTVDAHLRAIFAKLDIPASDDVSPRVLAVRRWFGELDGVPEPA
jgi:DNA-binding NarL/FixJ family response regulator